MAEEGEVEHMLREDVALNKENNKILKKIYSSIRWGRFFSLLYWFIILGGALGLYYFLQPYLDGIRGLLVTTKQLIENPKEFISTFVGGGNAIELPPGIEIPSQLR